MHSQYPKWESKSHSSIDLCTQQEMGLKKKKKTRALSAVFKAEKLHESISELEEHRKPNSKKAGMQAGNKCDFLQQYNYERSSYWVTNPFALYK